MTSKFSYIPKLEVGSKIRPVNEMITFQRLKPFVTYRVSEIKEKNGQPVYVFCRNKGHKIIVAHYASKIDAMLGGNVLEEIGGKS